jgi:hypothetical protein
MSPTFGAAASGRFRVGTRLEAKIVTYICWSFMMMWARMRCLEAS